MSRVDHLDFFGWFDQYDKLSITRIIFHEIFKQDLETSKEQVIFVGDSPNDMPMFDYFPNAVGVANVMEFIDQIPAKPAWITKHAGGFGFAELADMILNAKSV